MGGYAWVTLATNNSYSLGALVLAHSLKKSNTAHKMVVLISPAVSEPMREQLQTVFDVVKMVDVLDSKDEAHLALMKRPDLGITFTKIHCWRLVEFEKCVFLDADTLVVRNCDELFEREEFSAAPDVSWPDCFNSGVFVFRPSIETFNKLLQFAVENRSFDGGDQGLLNQFFSGWATEDIKKHLPFVYNLTSIAAYSYIPAFKHYGSETRIVHFIGEGKPWLQQLDVATRTVVPSTGSEHLAPLLQQWWDVFCEKVHPNLDKSLESNNDGMLQPPVDASSNTVAIALTDEPQTERLTEPCTPYREKDDFRQYNLPYQPFDVRGSSGELLNVEFILVSASEKGEDPVEENKTEESFEPNSEGDGGGKKEVEEGGGKEMEEEPVQEERNNVESNNEGRMEDGGDQNQQEEPPPVKEENDHNSFFPDENYINNYMEQNVLMYQPFENHHETHHERRDRDESHREHRERQPEQDAQPLHRFLTIPEDDQRQSGNVLRNVEQEHSPPKHEPPVPLECPPPPQDNPSPRESTPPPKEQPVPEKRELAKSKSMSYIASDFKPIDVSPPRSIWKSQPNLNLDPNRRYSMPKLKPILPKQNSFTKSVPSEMPKVTLYTEFLMSSEYKDPIDLPKDKIGFVESHIHKKGRLRRCKSDADIRSKFGPLPYICFPEVQKPVIPKKFPPRHLDNEVYDLSKCKRQMGNKPKAKNEEEGRENVRMLPALKPIAPAKDKKSTLIKKRKSKELSPGVGGREKMAKREPKTGRERRREPKVTPRNVSTPGNGDTLDQILQKLREFSKDYQHFFGVSWGDKKKTVKCKNAEVQAGENERECRTSETFQTVLTSVSTRSTETQTGKEAKQDGAEFRQFRNYVKDKRETSQKGLLGIQDILGEVRPPGTEVDGSSMLNSRVLRAEMTAGQREGDATTTQEYAKSKTIAEDEGSDSKIVKATSKEEIEGKNIPDLDHISPSQSGSPAELQRVEKAFPESNSLSTTQSRSLTTVQQNEKTSPETKSFSKSQSRNSAEVQKVEKTFPESNSISTSPNRSPADVKQDKKTFPEPNRTSQSISLTEVQEDEKTLPEPKAIITSKSRSPAEVQQDEKTFRESNLISASEIINPAEKQEGDKTFPEPKSISTFQSRSPAEMQKKDEKTFPESNSVSISQNKIPAEVQQDDKSFSEPNSISVPQSRSPAEMHKNEKTFQESNPKSEGAQRRLENDPKTDETSKELDSAARRVKRSEKKCERKQPNSNDVIKTPKNVDISKDSFDSSQFPSPESEISNEKTEASSRTSLASETPETTKEGESERIEEIRQELDYSSGVFQTPENGNITNDSLDPRESSGPVFRTSKENGDRSEEHSRTKGCDHPSEQNGRKTEHNSSTAKTTTEPQTTKNGISTEDAVVEKAPIVSSHVITLPEKPPSEEEETEKPQQQKMKNWMTWIERPKNPNEILCVPDFETPRSSRVTLPTPKKAAADQPETTAATENRKSTVPDGNGEANGLDSPEGTVRIVGKKRSGRKTSTPSSKPSSPPSRNGGFQQDLNGGSGIAGAIAQLSLDAGAQTAGSAAASAAQQEYLRRQNWETGNMDYMGRDSFDNIWSKICQTLEAKETEEEAAAAAAGGGSPGQTTAEEKKPEAIPPTEDPVTLATILQKCPEFIETLPGEPAAGPVEDDEIIFSKPENRQSCLTNIAEVEEGKIESAPSAGTVKLSDILQPGSGSDSKCEKVPDKKVEPTTEGTGPKGEKVQPLATPTTQITPPTPTPEQVQPPALPTPEKTTASPKAEQAPPSVAPTGGNVQSPTAPSPVPPTAPPAVTPTGDKVQSPIAPPAEGSKVQPPATPTPEQVQPPLMPTAEKTTESPKAEQAPPAVAPTGDKVQPPTAPLPVAPTGDNVQSPPAPSTVPATGDKVQSPTAPPADGSKAQPPATPTPEQAQLPTAPTAPQVPPPSTPTGEKTPAAPAADKTQPPSVQTTAQVPPPTTPTGEKTPGTPTAEKAQPPSVPTTAQVPPPATPTGEKTPGTPTAEKAQPPSVPTTAQVPPPATPTGEKSPAAPTAEKSSLPPTSAPEQPQPPTSQPSATPTADKPQPPVTPTPEKVTPPVPSTETPTAEKIQPPATPEGSKPEPPTTPAADKAETPKPPTGEKAAQPEVLPTDAAKPTELSQPEKPSPPTPEGQPTAEKQATQCTTVAIPSPPITFPGAPFEEKGKPTAKGKKPEDKPEVKSEPIPLPPPDSPTVAPTTQEPTAKVSDTPKDEGKQKKGVFSKILEMVGVSPKEKNGGEGAKSVFYDVQGGAEEAKEVEQASEVKEKPEGEAEGEVKASDAGEKPTEPQKTEEVPKVEEAVKTEEKAEQQQKKEQKGKQGQGPKQKPSRGPQDGKKGAQASRKSPSPKLTIPQTPPATAVTTPTPPPQGEVPPRKNSGLLKVDDTILETPPVTEAPKESVAEVIKGKVDDIIGKAKSEVESLLQDRRSAEKEVGESTDLINTMKLMVGAEEQPVKPEEVEELKVTSEEDRKRHKGETVTSKLSDQILKAIPPPRRKAISEATASTSSIPKATTAPEQQKTASGDSKTPKAAKPSSIPVPPPRSRGKPSPPKGKGKK